MKKIIKPYCDCHKADAKFDGNCHYSEANDNCEHCWNADKVFQKYFAKKMIDWLFEG